MEEKKGHSKKLEQLTLLNQIGREFSSSLDLDSVIDAIMSRVKDVLGCEACSVILHDEQKQALVFYAASGVGAGALKGMSIPVDRGIAGWVFTSRTPAIRDKVDSDERFYPGVDEVTGVRTRSLLCVPMEKHDRVLGVIEAVNKKHGGFTGKDQDMLTVISQLAGISIENSIIHKNLEQKNSELQRMNSDMEEFVHLVSHDLQTPLVTIEGYADLVKSAAGDREGERRILEYMERIGENARNMLRFIRRLLRYIRLERDLLSFEEFDPRGVLEEVLVLLEEEIRRSGAEIKVDGEFRAIRYDSYLFHHILLNLLENSLTFTVPGRSPLIQVSCAREAGEARFSVADNGPGLSGSEQENAFRIFTRGENSSGAEGRGIGLAFVKKAVEMSGGRVWIESAPGRGSTVCFTIPD
jgi:signal transduction histidine kinase